MGLLEDKKINASPRGTMAVIVREPSELTLYIFLAHNLGPLIVPLRWVSSLVINE